METVIQTTRSALLKWKFKDPELLKQCCEEVKPKLLEKPEIRVYGKICHQNRNIGFSPMSRSRIQILWSASSFSTLDASSEIVNRTYKSGDSKQL